MNESNGIEGENGLNPKDLEVMKRVMKHGINTHEELLDIHGMLTEHLNVNWSGKWRTCQVYIGDHVPPHEELIPTIMEHFFETQEDYDSWEWHNIFEHIHPFVDFNGRTGRLLWLSKARNEGYKFRIPFLQMYYYQTLQHTQKGAKIHGSTRL